MVKVSVIVPVYNVEKYLRRCLDSLVNQTLKDIEIILIDDASPDNSIEIMREYESLYPNLVQIIRSKENVRQGGARNLGLKRAQGEYIGFVDSDDWVDVTMFEKLYNCAIQTNSNIVDCDYYEAKGLNDSLKKVKSNSDDQVGELNLDKKKSLILSSGRMWTKLFKNSLFKDNGLLFPEKLTYEDNEIMPIIMAKAEKLAKVDEGLYFYFIAGNASTTQKRNSYHHFDRLPTSINMIGHFINRNLLNLFKAEIEYKFIQLYYINTIFICIENFDRPQVKQLNEIRTYMKVNYPNYRKNGYFMSRSTKWIKLLTFSNDIHPRFAVMLYNVRTMVLKLLKSK
jgi:glycosyltransferase involved in cell wall biosynthesis